ncbi:MAG: hypothetical protein EBT15_10945 [Betaproteobacteria bacterium]|nr:hypothetical protein [Betaproteobacteria bacterium]
MSTSYSNTWEGVIKAASDAGAKYPELVAAQWALESAWGESTSGKNNFFGIKGKGTERKTHEVVDGKTVTITAGFIDFEDLGDCINYLVTRWYKDFKGYKGVNNAPSGDEAARQLVAQGYATDPEYAEKLISLMRDQKGKGTGSKRVKAAKAATPVLFQLEALEDTWLKKEPVQASELGEDQKVAVAKGKAYGVCAYEEVPRDAHARVELAGGAGTWFVFEPHWKGGQGTGATKEPGSVDWDDFNCLLTPHLTVGEVLQWDRRRTPGPNSAARSWLLKTAAEYEKVRVAWGSALGVTSFYRPEPINGQVGGAPGSKHTTGEAFDVYPVGRTLESFYQWIRVRWTGGLGDGRLKGFIHLDTRGGGGFVPGAGVRPSAEWLY